MFSPELFLAVNNFFSVPQCKQTSLITDGGIKVAIYFPEQDIVNTHQLDHHQTAASDEQLLSIAFFFISNWNSFERK